MTVATVSMTTSDKSTVTIKPDPRELKGLYAAFKTLSKEANTSLKDEVQSISRWTAQGMVYASYSAPMPAQAAVVAKTVRAGRDRMPTVTIGGGRSRTSRGTEAGVLLFGSEFGSNPKVGGFPNGGRRFPYRSAKEGRGNRGYWIFPALKGMQPEITHRWKTAVDRVLHHWEDGPGGGLNG